MFKGVKKNRASPGMCLVVVLMPILISVKLLVSIGLGRCHLSTLIILREHMTLNLLDSLSTFLIISSL